MFFSLLLFFPFFFLPLTEKKRVRIKAFWLTAFIFHRRDCNYAYSCGLFSWIFLSVKPIYIYCVVFCYTRFSWIHVRESSTMLGSRRSYSGGIVLGPGKANNFTRNWDASKFVSSLLIFLNVHSYFLHFSCWYIETCTHILWRLRRSNLFFYLKNRNCRKDNDKISVSTNIERKAAVQGCNE